jgi:hypothetical protein
LKVDNNIALTAPNYVFISPLSTVGPSGWEYLKGTSNRAVTGSVVIDNNFSSMSLTGCIEIIFAGDGTHTSGNVVWRCLLTLIRNGRIVQTGVQTNTFLEAVSVPSANQSKIESLAISTSNISVSAQAGDILHIEVDRLQSYPSDDYAYVAYLLGVRIPYTGDQ